MWGSGLRIWHCHCSGSGHCSGAGLISGLETFAHCTYSQKKKKKIKTKSQDDLIVPNVLVKFPPLLLNIRKFHLFKRQNKFIKV